MTHSLSPARSFHVLAVDDTPAWTELVVNAFERVPDVEVTVATNFETARTMVEKRHFDGAVIDLQLLGKHSNDTHGLRLIEDLGTHSPTARIIVATADLKRFSPETRRLDQIIAVLDKATLNDRYARQHFSGPLDDFRRSEVHLEDTASLVAALEDKCGHLFLDGRQPSEATWLRPRLELELDRLVRQLFGHLGRHTDEDSVPPKLGAIRLDTQGMSGSVVCLAQVGLPLIGESAKPHVQGGAVVIKFGPVADIQDEEARFRRFVQYGVPLRHRVELTGSARTGKLGAVVYGFVGGGTSGVRSFDTVVASGDEASITETLRDLFEAPNKQWYEIEGRKRSLNDYRSKRWPGKFDATRRRIGREGDRWAARFPQVRVSHDEDGAVASLRVGDTELTLAPEGLWTDYPFGSPMPTCIVHGDLHGGNVLVADDVIPGGQRVALIDYGSAGFGPRLLDFAFLMATLRLGCSIRTQTNGADLDASVRESQFRKLDDAEAFRMLQDAARGGRVDDKVLAYARTKQPPHERDRSKAPASFALVDWAIANFDFDYDEWLATMILVAYRQAGHDRVDSLGRVRTLAWVDALLRSLRKAQSAAG